MGIDVRIAEPEDAVHAETISALIEAASKTPDAALAKRPPEYLAEKIKAGKAIVAVTKENRVVGFCYLETWEHGQYVANSGLVVDPEFRKQGLAKKIKQCVFDLTCKKYPDAKLFGLTTNPAVVKINTELGYRHVQFSDLTNDDEFWAGCKTCKFYDVLTRAERKNCLCTGMLLDLTTLKKKSC